MTPTSTYGSGSARIYARMIDPLLRALRHEITALCTAHRVTDVIDIACATGAQCRSLHAAGITTTGIDLSPEMIGAARRRGSSAIKYVVGSALALPFPDDNFSAAILSLCLHEHSASDRERMLAEAVRVVRPGGIIIVAEYSPPLHWNFTWGFIRVIERMAGHDHFRNFRAFVHAGGIDALAARLPRIESRYSLFNGTIGIIVGEKD